MENVASAGEEKVLLLVLEQDPHIKQLERYFLERAGFQVEFAANGEEGLKRAQALLPSLVITEILIPRLDGLSVCRALKGDPRTRPIRVLMFSMLAAEQRALEAGADAFLRKPLDDALLLGTIQRLLEQRKGGGTHGAHHHGH
jgi:CheY-like chemotaxis protein